METFRECKTSKKETRDHDRSSSTDGRRDIISADVVRDDREVTDHFVVSIEPHVDPRSSRAIRRLGRVSEPDVEFFVSRDEAGD
jgi:hypothetical protein